MTDLKHRLGKDKHISRRLYCDDLLAMYKLHLLMKEIWNSPDPINLRSA